MVHRRRSARDRPLLVTAIFGRYEPLRSLPAGVRGLAITDDDGAVDGWRLAIHRDPSLTPRAANRYAKARIHKFTTADVTVYVDGQFLIREDPGSWALDVLGDGDFAAFRHPARDCVYLEGETCIEKGRGDPDAIAAQLERYRAEGLPDHAGLFGGGLLVRRNTEGMRALGDAWWNEVCAGSERDQISLGYLVWKHRIDVRVIPGSLYKPPFAKFVGHPRKKR